jgi:hypothetical protein
MSIRFQKRQHCHFKHDTNCFFWETIFQEEITGMNPKASFGNRFRSKLRGIISSALRDCSPPLGGIIRPANFSALCFRSLGLITTYQFRYAALSELEFHNKLTPK